VVSFTARQIYSLGKISGYTLDRMLGELKNGPGRYEEEKKNLSLPGIKPELSSP
jgi:hypothetical protein